VRIPTSQRKVAVVFGLALAGFAAAIGSAWHSNELLRGTENAADAQSSLFLLVAAGFFGLVLLSALSWAVGRQARARSSAAESLRNQLSFTAAITDSLGEGVYALDREGRLTLLNRAGQEMLGWTEEELLGKAMHEAVHFQRADGTRNAVGQCPLLGVLRTGQKFHGEDDVFTRRDGTIFPV